MNVLVLMGSPHRDGNTAALCRPFMDEMAEMSAEVRYVFLAEKRIEPCLGCYACQNVSDSYGCAQRDDMWQVVEAIRSCDCGGTLTVPLT